MLFAPGDRRDAGVDRRRRRRRRCDDDESGSVAGYTSRTYVSSLVAVVEDLDAEEIKKVGEEKAYILSSN